VRLGLLIGIIGLVLLLWAADRLVKARRQASRRRDMTTRLTAATDRADQQLGQRQVARQASEALTSFMPAIQRPPSDLPEVAAHRPSRPRAGRERPASRDHDAGQAGRRRPRSGEHKARAADKAPHAEPPTRPARPAHSQPDSRPAS
jgi:hypothetical protein